MTVRIVGEGPVDVVWVHGMFLDPSMWDPVIARLGPGVRSWVVALRGHRGESEPARWRFDDWVAELREVVAGTPSPPLVVGHSLGGWVAAAMACGEEAPPLRGVLVINHTLHLAPALRPGFEGFVPTFSTGGIPRPVAEQFLDLWHAPGALGAPEREREVARLAAIPPENAAGSCAAALAGPDVRARASAAPLAFLLGGRDPLTAREELPEASTVTVEPSWAHFPASPDVLAAEVRRLLDRP